MTSDATSSSNYEGGNAQTGSEEMAEDAKRDRSSIDFPYVPLDSAIEVARALYRRCGFGSCDQDELAAEMGQTVSGAFRQKTSAARTFGFVSKDGRSAFVLTDLGKRAVSPTSEKAAIVEAFLNVPLYQQVYEKFRGHNLPPAKALEREMETLGVAKKQTDRARQAFERSANFSGFFDSGKEKLVRPRIEGEHIQNAETAPLARTEEKDNEREVRTIVVGSPLSDIDPIIRGLIDRLPPSGEMWPKAKRKLWLQILENSFELVYEDDSSTGPPDDLDF